MRGVLLLLCSAAAVTAQVYRIDTVAGSGVPGFAGDEGPAAQAELSSPSTVMLDRSGRLFIGDRGNGRVRRMDVDGTIRTVAEGLELVDLAVDALGNFYTASPSRVYVHASNGTVTELAADAGLTNVQAIAAAWDGTLLVADGGRLLRITPDRLVSDVATGLDGTINITDVVVGADGSVYFLAGRIYRIQTSGAVLTIAESVAPEAGSQIAIDATGQVLLSGSKVWKIVNGVAVALAGTEAPGYSGDGGASTAAQVNTPGGLSVDAAGNVYFADTGNHRVRVLVAPAVAPAQPVYPANRASDVWPRLMLQWTSVPWAASYEVQMGTKADALETVANVSSPVYTPSALRAETTYFWRVTARSGALPLVSSEVWSFTTSAGDRVPNVPVSPTPSNFAMAQPVSLTLTWDGRFASRFEVYFGETLDPPRVGLVNGNRYRVEELKAQTTYYWRVVALNETNQGSSTSSALWQFTTTPVGGYPFVITTVAGTTLPTADGTTATAAVLELPRKPAVDSAGNIYFIDGGKRVRRIAPDGRLTTMFTPASGTVSALAVDAAGNLLLATPEYIVRIPRTGQRAFVAGQPSRRGFMGDGGKAIDALFDGITSIAIDRSGTIYVADSRNGRVRAITAGNIRTFAGTGTCGEEERTGSATNVGLCGPTEVAVDPTGNVFVYERGRLLKLGSDGYIQPFVEGTVNAAGGIAADHSYVYFVDREAMLIYRADGQGNVTTYAGELDPGSGRAFGFAGDGLPAARAKFGFPDGLAIDGEGRLLVAEWFNHRIRQIDTAGFIRTVGGSDTAWGDRGAATSAYLFYPTDVAVDGSGAVYVADSLNYRIRRVSANRSMDTIAGTGIGAGRFQDAELTDPRTGRSAGEFFLDTLPGSSIEVDRNGTLLFDDNRFQWYLPNRTAAIFGMSSNGVITEQIDSKVAKAGGFARGLSGELYVTDTLGHRVLRIGTDGAVATVAGTGKPGYSGDGGAAILSQLESPGAITVNADGEIFVAEFGRIRKIGRDGLISTVANEHANGLAHDRLGNLYVSSNRFVYVLTPTGLLRIAGRESATGSGDGVAALDARIGEARGLAVGPEGDVFLADATEHRVRRLTRNLPAGISIISGQDQSATAGTQLALPVVVRVNGRAGLPVPGVTLRFLSADRGVTISASAVTNAQGQVTLRPTAGSRSGDFIVQISSPGLSTTAELRVNVTP